MSNRGIVMLMCSLMVFCALSGAHGVASAQSLSSSLGVVPYPSKGQPAAQQTKDEGECFAWAKQQTGIDPFALANTPPPAQGPAVGGGERLGGAARGALGGLAIGAIAGDAGKGAGIGAVVGTMAGGHRARQNKAAKQQQAAQAKNNSIQTFNRAFCACMEGRGYTVR